MNMRELHYGDCLDILPQVADETVDLIYLDPPFKSDANYNMLFGSKKDDDVAQLRAFTDTWYWRPDHEDMYLALIQCGGSIGRMIEALRVILGQCGMLAYLMFMTERLVAMKRVMKPTASIYLHCDPTASHYIKIMMDAIFGHKNFQNEIVWPYGTGGRAKSRFSRKHDIILFYSNGNKPYFNGDAVGVLRGREKRNNMKKGVDADGRVFFSIKSAGKIYKYYEDEKMTPTDVWVDVKQMNQKDPERLGYPTQKPLTLLERIIKASSNKGDVVLDPFCGCGTAVDAAEALGRQWIGIDISCLAINLIRERMENVHGKVVSDQITIAGVPRDEGAAEMLFRKNPFEFERWAVGLIRGRPNDKQRGDKGSDGELIFPGGKSQPQRGIISVKGGQAINPGMVRDLAGSMNSHHADMGVLITLTPPTRGMIEAANGYGQWTDNFTKAKWPKVQIITIGELLDGQMPKMPTQLSPYIKASHSHAASKQETLL